MRAPDTALKAAGSRYLLVSGWPWRSAGYLFATFPAAVVAAAGLAIPAVPWLILAGGDYQPGVYVALILLGAGLIAALGPLIAVPATVFARGRLRIADTRPAGDRPRFPPAGSGPIRWLRARYTDPAAWREVGYVCLLATVVPALTAAALLSALVSVAFIASPFLVLAQKPGAAPVTLAAVQVTTVRQAVPYAIAGVLLLPIVPYLITLVAGADAAVARALLFPGAADNLRAELTEVSRSRARMADAFEAERRRIERDLHDGAQQKLVSLTMQLGLAQLDLPPQSPAAAAVAIAHEQAKQLMAELRELIRGIQPQVLTDLGLPAALDELADQSAIPVAVEAHIDGRLPGQAENTAYFAVAEALTNIAKHSGATKASVSARVYGHTLTVEITDNGHGGADPGRGSGLTGLADRVAVAGGRMLLSSPPGGPTVLRVEVPCPPG
ncbi:MAG: sensor domain-containing protein [Streptosporangiaceae bacterium]|jgi:signal transduction histidine kinase